MKRMFLPVDCIRLGCCGIVRFPVAFMSEREYTAGCVWEMNAVYNKPEGYQIRSDVAVCAPEKYI